MTNLVRASRELFSRTSDETFESFDQLYQYCSTLQEHSIDRWEPPDAVTPTIMDDGQLGLSIGSTGQFQLNDWSFSQLCGLARVDKLTLNRLRIETAVQALTETLPRGRKPLQVLTTGKRPVSSMLWLRVPSGFLSGGTDDETALLSGAVGGVDF